MRTSNLFKGAPMLSITFPFLLGIYLQEVTQLTWTVLLCGASVSILMLVLFLKKRNIVFVRITHTLLFLLLMFVGAMRLFVEDDNKYDTQLPTTITNGEVSWIAEISAVYPKKHYERSVAKVVALLKDESILPIKNKFNLLIYNYTNTTLEKGMMIQSSQSITPIKNKGNPGEFDIAKFYKRKHIKHQVFLKGDISIYKQSYLNFWSQFIGVIRSYTNETLERIIPNPTNLSIAKALLLGKEENYIEEETRQAYITAGVVHVIVISGLHIGLLAWIISGLLRPLRKSRYRSFHWLRLISILLCIWIFGAVAGLGVSVVRAAIMFSLIEINNQLGYLKQSPFHVLALTAILILCINPYELWSLGFIFSFLAVAGIFLLSNNIERITRQIRPRWLARIAQLMFISFAANLFLLPITIYLFKTLYPYFPFANIIAVPLVGVILQLEVISLCIPFFPYLQKVFGAFISFLIDIMTNVIYAIRDLPYSSIDVSITVWELLCISGGCFFLVYFMLHRTKLHLYIAFSCLLTFLFINTWTHLQVSKQHVFCVLNTGYSTSAIVTISGNRGALWISDSTISDKQLGYAEQNTKQTFHLKQLTTHFIPKATSLQWFELDKVHAVYVADADAWGHPSLKRATHIILHPSISLKKVPKYYKEREITFIQYSRVLQKGSTRNMHNLQQGSYTYNSLHKRSGDV